MIVLVAVVVLVLLAEEATRWFFRPEARRLRMLKKIGGSRRGSGKYRVIGTSGSPDYLRDLTGNRRYWPSRVEDVGENLDAVARQPDLGDLVARTASSESEEID